MTTSNDFFDRLSRYARPVLAGLGGLWLLFGLWAICAPHSFFEVVAEFEPYNRHFIHDIGAMQIGLGTGALAGVVTLRPLVAALIGLTAYQMTHVISHIIDRDLGGTPWFDIPSLAALAVLGGAALVGALRKGADNDSG